MGRKIVVISASLREKSNSEALAAETVRGAEENGNEAELIRLKGKDIRFCKGCLACQQTQRCVIEDDANEIAEKVKDADTLVFATPIYYYEMSGQLKTLLDRLNPLYPSDYRFRNVYLLTVAAEDEADVPQRAVSGLQGWIECFEKASFGGSLFIGGLGGAGEAQSRVEDMKKAYAFGKALQ